MTQSITEAPHALWDNLLAAKLIRKDELETCSTYLQGNPRAKMSELVGFLQQERILTGYQAELLLDDRLKELVCSCYTILDVVGKGSFGKVYKVKKHDTGKLYAMKVLSERNPDLVSKFAQRLQAFSRFRSRSIVPLVHIFCQHGKMSLVWPFVDEGQYGVTLEKLVESEEKLSPKETALIAIQIVNALQTVHGQDLFHGLLKPSNVLVTSKRAVRLLDFGIGFLLSVGRNDSLLDTITHANQIASNLDCSAPETINDSSVRTPASDRYSLGCMLYYCLTGQYPFPDPNPVKKMLGHEMEEPTPIRELRPDVPKVLAAIVHKLLRKIPEERFSSTDELFGALEALKGPSSGMATPRPATRQRFIHAAPSSHPKAAAKPATQPSVAPKPQPKRSEPKQSPAPDEKGRKLVDRPVFWLAMTALSVMVGAGAVWLF